MSSILVPLTKGYEAVIDEDAADLVLRYSWQALVSSGKKAVYATALTPRAEGSKKLLMHRLIMDAPKGIQVDHRDNDGLNNRRYNLRFATNAQNCANRKHRGSSRYKGVFIRPNGRWVSCITKDGKKLHIGVFDCEIEAAKAHDEVARKLHGEFAYLNFGGLDAR